jgi:hypothetical protein
VKTVGAILVIVLVVSMFIILVCATLALTVGEPPSALGTVSAGTALLAAGLLSLGEAVSKSGSGVKVGRLSSFAFGIGCCTMGIVFLGYYLLPERYMVWTAVVVLASFALGLLGMWIDGRVYERETRRNSQLWARVNELPEERREKIHGLARSGQRREAIKEAKHLLGISLGDAAFVAAELKE